MFTAPSLSAPTGCCGIAFDLSEGDFQSTQCGWLH
ncbi:uncharacterized protein Dana_GF27710 [Drosophila ananassae]|uniref:Uncharacterized protein n=1 Tax=Drosophila ananassae TaxID=7217 RepID=A0A0P8XTQ9_DROAN|nr:uncharacterized protein Dana_GF27710 [Drosophila ananassae]